MRRGRKDGEHACKEGRHRKKTVQWSGDTFRTFHQHLNQKGRKIRDSNINFYDKLPNGFLV